MDPADMRAQAGRWRALADRCNPRGAQALREGAAKLEREADALESGTVAAPPIIVTVRRRD